MKYPIGIQDFEKIRQEGFVYVDKTEMIYELAHEGSYYFVTIVSVSSLPYFSRA